ncbi:MULTISPECIES: hypothetical protein [Bacillaceae]|uniref:Uncharacterized protein n=1 Tax=Evansella alkalicola TaxID=745819 RepID=A0ABS6JTG7_9BACI|nr:MULTISPECIES: hypothetical protein [Bacillaceae]MBU9721851.1 hypothetical protein [Bacillus alkalicola]
MRFFIIGLVILLLISCESNLRFSSEEPTPPIVTNAEIAPLSIQFLSTKFNENNAELFFELAHLDHSPVKKSDYYIEWPEYVFDQNDLPYKVTSHGFTYGNKENEVAFDTNAQVISLKIEPTPVQKQESTLQIPMFIKPILFENGYPFLIKNDYHHYLKTGEITLTEFEVEGNFLRFKARDSHPEASDKSLHYAYTLNVNGHEIFPLFTRNRNKYNGSTFIELEFANSIGLPSELIIKRMTLQDPEWRFNFSIPIKRQGH